MMKDFTEDLRKLLLWCEANPDLPTPCHSALTFYHDGDMDRLRTIIRAMGHTTKRSTDDLMYYEHVVGDTITIQTVALRDAVCRKVHVGVKVIPATTEVILPATPARVEPVYEWECGSVLAPAESEAASA